MKTDKMNDDVYLKALNEVTKHLDQAAKAADDAGAFTLYCEISHTRKVCEDFKERRRGLLAKAESMSPVGR